MAVDFDSWDVCDECCQNLFGRTELASRKAAEWSAREEKFVRRAGFVLMARLCVTEKKADDEQFVTFLSIILKATPDSRDIVNKAISWALRNIGKRNLNLNMKALEVAREMQQNDAKSVRWIATDAIRELTSEAVKKRLKDR